MPTLVRRRESRHQLRQDRPRLLQKTTIERVVALGGPNCYRRFGSLSAGQYGLGCQFDVPKEAFMAIALRGSTTRDCADVVRYQAEIREL